MTNSNETNNTDDVNTKPNWAIIGLGNPGQKYKATRHNIGFRCIDKIAHQSKIELNERRKAVVLGVGNIGQANVVLVKPRTFVNLSGEAFLYIKQRFSIQASNILVIYDDMDLPLGMIRLKAFGGSGGHNGINSINHSIGSNVYPRIRVGIDRPIANHIDHVLGRFNKDEESLIEVKLNTVMEITQHIIADGIDSAMNHFN